MKRLFFYSLDHSLGLKKRVSQLMGFEKCVVVQTAEKDKLKEFANYETDSGWGLITKLSILPI